MKLAEFASIGAAALFVGLAYALAGLWIGMLVVVAVGGLWLLGAWRGWRDTENVGLPALIVVAGTGPWLLAPAPPLLLAVVAALVAWDLGRLRQRLAATTNVEAPGALVRAHLQRMASIAAIGLALGAIALGVRVPLSFGWALAIGVLAIFAIGRVLRSLQRGDE